MNDNTKPGRLTEGQCFTSEHVYVKNGVAIPFVCHAQEFIFVDDLEQPEASFFAYSYFRTDVEDTRNRPLFFTYGGGPGDAGCSLGFWSPKLRDPSYKSASGPYPAPVDNPDWIIDIADIVCIDAPGSGYARIYSYDARGKYWGVNQDALAFIDFFKFWLTKYSRWSSPKFIAGQSYGGIRTAILSDLLCGGPYYSEQRQYTHGIALNGAVIGFSSIELDFRTLDPSSAGVPAETANFMLTYAAVNWHWNREGKPALCDFIDEAEKFVADEYLRAKWLGDALPKEERDAFLKRLEYFTGLPAAMWAQAPDYEIDAETFAAQYLAGEGKRLCLYDARISAPSARHLGFYEDYADDAFNSTGTFQLAPMVHEYHRNFLGIDWPRDWLEVNFDANCQWTWTSNRTVAQHFAAAIRRNPDMRALIFMGLYDLAACAGLMRYSLRHYGIDFERVKLFESESCGHGTSSPEAMREFGGQVRELVSKAIK